MAKLKLYIDVDDKDMPRVMEAMRSVFANKLPPDATDDMVIEAIRQAGIANLIGAVQGYEKRKQQMAADAFMSDFNAG